MTFYGKENEVKEPDEVKPLRTFIYETWGGHEQTVEAHYLQFMTEHVTFWIEQDGDSNQLVIAVANKQVNSLKEVIEPPKAVTVKIAHMQGTVPFAYKEES